MNYFKEKIVKDYIKEKSIEIEKLDKNKYKYIQEIKEYKKVLEKNKIKHKQVLNINKELFDKYNQLKDIFKKRGIVLYLKNKNYNIKEWDNLYLNLEFNKYYIYTKNKEVLYCFNEEETYILKELIINNNYSAIVTRIDGNIVKIQLMLKNIVNKENL